MSPSLSWVLARPGHGPQAPQAGLPRSGDSVIRGRPDAGGPSELPIHLGGVLLPFTCHFRDPGETPGQLTAGGRAVRCTRRNDQQARPEREAPSADSQLGGKHVLKHPVITPGPTVGPKHHLSPRVTSCHVMLLTEPASLA